MINRLQFVDGLPASVQPTLSPQSPTGEIMRYTLRVQRPDWPGDLLAQRPEGPAGLVSERQFRRVPRIIDIVSGGGTVKRYEVHPDPERLMRYGITLDKLQSAIENSNANVGGDYMVEGENLLNVRGIGLIGGGLDPTRQPPVLHAATPAEAVQYIRSEEDRRLLRNSSDGDHFDQQRADPRRGRCRRRPDPLPRGSGQSRRRRQQQAAAGPRQHEPACAGPGRPRGPR